MDDNKKDDKTPQVRTVIADVARLIKTGQLSQEEAQKIDPKILAEAKVYSENIGEMEFDLSVIAPEFVKNRNEKMARQSVADGEAANSQLTPEEGGVEILSQPLGTYGPDAVADPVEGAEKPGPAFDQEGNMLNADDTPKHVIDLNQDGVIDGEEIAHATNTKNEQIEEPIVLGTKGQIKKEAEAISVEKIPEAPVSTPVEPIGEPMPTPPAPEVIKEKDEKLELETHRQEIESKITELTEQFNSLVSAHDAYINKKQAELTELDDVIGEEHIIEQKEKQVEVEEQAHPDQKRTLEQERWTLEDHRRELEKKRWEINTALTDVEKTEVNRKKEESRKEEEIVRTRKELEKINKRLALLDAFKRTEELRTTLAELKKNKEMALEEERAAEGIVKEKKKNIDQKRKTEERMRKEIKDSELEEQLAKTEETRHASEEKRSKLEDDLRAFLLLEWKDEDAEKEATDLMIQKKNILDDIEGQIKDVEKELSQLPNAEL